VTVHAIEAFAIEHVERGAGSGEREPLDALRDEVVDERAIVRVAGERIDLVRALVLAAPVL
jgi:hypothetical protein